MAARWTVSVSRSFPGFFGPSLPCRWKESCGRKQRAWQGLLIFFFFLSFLMFLTVLLFPPQDMLTDLEKQGWEER